MTDVLVLQLIFEAQNASRIFISTSNIIEKDEELSQICHNLIMESILIYMNQQDDLFKQENFLSTKKLMEDNGYFKNLFDQLQFYCSNPNILKKFTSSFIFKTSCCCLFQQINSILSLWKKLQSNMYKITKSNHYSIICQCLIENLCLILDQNFLVLNIDNEIAPQQIVLFMLNSPNDNLIDLVRLLAIHLYSDQSKFSEVFWHILMHIRCIIGKSRLSDVSYYQPIRILIDLIKLKFSSNNPILSLIVDSNKFNPYSENGFKLQNESYFGTLLAVPVFNETSEDLSNNLESELDNDMDSSQLVFSMRTSLQDLHNQIHELFQLILVNSSTRQKALSYLAQILEKNSKKAHIQYDATSLSSDNLLINLNCLFLQFCEKVELSKVDNLYPFSKMKMVDYSSYTTINSSPEAVEKFAALISQPTEIRFPTACFFLTYHSHHITLLPAFRKFNELNQVINEVNMAIQQFNLRNSQNQASLSDQIFIKQLKQRLKSSYISRFCSKLILCSNNVLHASLRFYYKAACWIVDIFNKHKQIFIHLPEYFIEDVSEFMLFILTHKPLILYECDQMLIEPLAKFYLTFIINHKSIRNPYLIAKLIEVMYALNPTIHKYLRFYNLIVDNELADNHLFLSLISYYIDVESLGSSSGFYDKFGIRHNLSVIMRLLWSDSNHRNRLISYSQQQNKFFVSFVNLLVNDLTYLIDESLVTLRNIHNIQNEMDSNNWFNQSQENIRSRQDQLRNYQRKCNSYVRLTNETIKTLNYLSEGLKSLFIQHELIDRMAVLIDYCIIQMTGPSYVELKVKDPSKYEFDPKLWLKSVVNVYLNLESDQLINSIANDERSFSLEKFQRCFAVLEKTNIISISDFERFKSLCTKAQDLQSSNKQDFPEDEIPEDFKDPLMNILMKDPVILPNSGMTVDRTVISRHLLNSSTDPFSRMPLTIDEILPANDLKEKIHNWIAQRLKKD